MYVCAGRTGGPAIRYTYAIRWASVGFHIQVLVIFGAPRAYMRPGSRRGWFTITEPTLGEATLSQWILAPPEPVELATSLTPVLFC